MLTDNTTSII